MKKLFCAILLMCVVFCGCQSQSPESDWESFTPDKSYSFDKKYYAVQEATKVDGIDFINVNIYNADDDLVYSFRFLGDMLGERYI